MLITTLHRLGTAALLASLPAGLLAQEPSPPAASPAPVSAPVTAGTIGLMLAHPEPSGAVELLTRGLSQEDTATRAAAARAARILSARDLVPALTRALQAETDVAAAAEEVAALALLGGAESDTVLLEAATRLQPQVASAVADALARTRRQAALDLLPRLRPLGLQAIEPVIRLATASQPDALVPLAVGAMREGDAVLWSAALSTSTPSTAKGLEGLIQVSLTSPVVDIREASYEHLAVQAQLAPLSAALAEAVVKAGEATGDATAGGGAAPGYELLRRAQGGAPKLSLLAPPTPAPATPLRMRRFTELLGLLTTEERAAIGFGPRAQGSVPSQARKSPREPSRGFMRTVSAFPPGFGSATVRASGCRPQAYHTAVAEVLFREDGRPQKIGLLAMPTDPRCAEAATALFSAAVAPTWRLGDVGSSDVLVLRLDDEFLQCAEEPDPHPFRGSTGVARVGQVKEPRKVHNTAPVYPEQAKQSRTQGMVILEAIIAPSGCVREVKVMEGPQALMLAALAAVARWRYTPTLLNGVAVPVVMTVTVNFRLD